MKLSQYFAFGISLCSLALANTYNVGPTQTYKHIAGVPWYTLVGGDIVNIYAKSGGACYLEKWMVSTQGTSWASALTVNGIDDPSTGAKACVSGAGAVQGTTSHDRWSGADNAQYSESLYVLGISLQSGALSGPSYIVINNLEITGAVQGALYTADDGSILPYLPGVAAIRLFNASHVRIKNCNIHGIGGNGVFGKPNGSYPGSMTDTQLLFNHIWGNGVSGSYSYHNSYLETNRSLYFGNWYQPLISGAAGSDLKDRSAGTIVSYNHFDGSAARFIDLVEPQDGWSDFGSAAYYGSDFVYGNIFEAHAHDVNFAQMGGMVHYGGDQGNTKRYRNQTLSFYDNTIVLVADHTSSYRNYVTTVELNTANVATNNNIIEFWDRTRASFAPQLILTTDGSYNGNGDWGFGANWVSIGWYISDPLGSFLGTSAGLGQIISPIGNDPGFVDIGRRTYTLALGSSCLGVGKPLPTLVTTNPNGGNYTPIFTYSPTAEMTVTIRANLHNLGAFN